MSSASRFMSSQQWFHCCLSSVQAEVRALNGQLESVKQELATEKQKCHLLEQTSTSAITDGRQILQSPKQELIPECITYVASS